MTFLSDLLELEHAPLTLSINYLLIPVTIINIDREGAKRFNKIYNWLKTTRWSKIERTKSGGIAVGLKLRLPAWDVRRTKTCVELTILCEEGMWRIQFRSSLPNKALSGSKAFKLFKSILLKHGIDLNDYEISNGPEVKKTIVPAPVKLARLTYVNHTFSKAHHIDFHSSYPAGLVNTHPEFKEVIEELYEKRHENEDYKAILNYSIGFMQSITGCGARWANLSRDAIHDNNRRIAEMTVKLQDAGNVVLLYNVDGIWYAGDVYHGDGEGTGLGQWSNDHVNCKFRAKSEGAYEFIEDGVYYPVVRGIPNEVKATWQWGDIYNEKAVPDIFTFTEEEGVKLYGEKTKKSK